MEFDIQKFLFESKLTNLSKRLHEDDNTGQILHTGQDDADATFDANSADPYGGEYGTKGSNWNDDPNKADYFKTQNGPDFDKEPAPNNLRVDKATKNLQSTQAKLTDLMHKKDALLMQYKSGQLTLDAYKDAIGNIPQQIKQYKDQIDQALNPSTDTGEEDELA